jgi:plasmid segregation protein ParM
VLSRDYIEYDGGYYVIGEGRKGFVADKQTDDDNYMLTLAAIVKELEARGMTDSVNRARIHLAVGLPLKWVQAQREDFKRYMLRNSSVEVGYKDRLYCIEFRRLYSYAAVLLGSDRESEGFCRGDTSCRYWKWHHEFDVSE